MFSFWTMRRPGRGVALGWRDFVDCEIEAGRLVAAWDRFVEFDRTLFARLTLRGRHRPLARRCLDILALHDERAPVAAGPPDSSA